MSGNTYDQVFELYRREGHSKVKIFESSDLAEIARLSAEKSGARLDLEEAAAEGVKSDD